MTIGILDYGVGNLGSIVSMHRKLAIPAARVTDPAQVADCSGLILPGVGAFDDAIDRLNASGLREPLEAHVDAGRPLLGICLGMQLLGDSSDEGQQAGLGLIPGRIRSMSQLLPPGFRVPFMGWAYVQFAGDHPVFDDSDEPQRYYFAHSYAFTTDADHAIGAVDHGEEITAVVARDNVLGTQFHPEKSHRFGMRVLDAFARWVEER